MTKKEILQLNLRYDDMTMTFFSKLFSILTKKSVVIFFIVLFIIQNAILVYPVYFYLSRINSFIGDLLITIMPLTLLILCLGFIERLQFSGLKKYFAIGYVGSIIFFIFSLIIGNFNIASEDMISIVLFKVLTPFANISKVIFFSLYGWSSDVKASFWIPFMVLLFGIILPVCSGILVSIFGYFRSINHGRGKNI